MLESVDFDAIPTKEEYKAEHDRLIEELVVLQQQARTQGVGIVVVFEGWNGSGKGSRISDLLYNLDARSTRVHLSAEMGFDSAQASSSASAAIENGQAALARSTYPFMQEFWQALGPRGDMTIYDCSWYAASVRRIANTRAYLDHELASVKKGRKRDAMASANAVVCRDLETMYRESIWDFEHQLDTEDYVVVKFFLQISRKVQRRRFRDFSKQGRPSWRLLDDQMTPDDYGILYPVIDSLLTQTDYPFAPWVIVNGQDRRAANLTIARTLVDRVKEGLARKNEETTKIEATRVARLSDEGLSNEAIGRSLVSSRFNLLDAPRVDDISHDLKLDDPVEYHNRLKAEQERLSKLQIELLQKRVPLLIAYEGWDAAGKGGNIKRVAQALDARGYHIFPSPAPTPDELAHPFLWRYWTRLPEAGRIAIYDRTWYGRVLVERVEGFARPDEWTRAYDEINEFERELETWGAILLKFWIDISQDEQLVRFQSRQADPDRQWKITDEDWRNREKYPAYRAAADDMFRLTSTAYAPWIVIESDCKKFARVKTLHIINDAIEKRLWG